MLNLRVALDCFFPLWISGTDSVPDICQLGYIFSAQIFILCACVRVCVYVCVCVRLRLRVRVRVFARLHACVRVCACVLYITILRLKSI